MSRYRKPAGLTPSARGKGERTVIMYRKRRKEGLRLFDCATGLWVQYVAWMDETEGWQVGFTSVASLAEVYSGEKQAKAAARIVEATVSGLDLLPVTRLAAWAIEEKMRSDGWDVVKAVLGGGRRGGVAVGVRAGDRRDADAGGGLCGGALADRGSDGRENG